MLHIKLVKRINIISDRIFVFDLDSTITAEEILPKIAEEIGVKEEIQKITEETMQGAIPFKKSLLKRSNVLKDISVIKIRKLVEDVKLNEKLVEFIRSNASRCYIITGNIDICICDLIKKIGMEGRCFSTEGVEKDDKLAFVAKVVEKREVVRKLKGNLVVIGDGNNDADMMCEASISVGFGGVRAIAPAVLDVCRHAIMDEDTLVFFLKQLL